MASPCHPNASECLNSGKCVINTSQNMTYCLCDPCHEGIFCENDVWQQTQFDTVYVYLVVFIIGLCLSVLNTSLCLELFIRCKRIRRTNVGVYLIVYSILSLLSSIFLVVGQAVEYYPNQLMNNPKQINVFHCYVMKIGYNTFVYLCIWFSACVAFERGLVIFFHGKWNGNRWRSIVTTIVIFAIAGGSATPMLVYKCDWGNVPHLQIARIFFIWFYFFTGITVYVLATLLVIISLVRHIRQYGTENGSPITTFRKLLYTHLFIFVPPIAYTISYIPYTVVNNMETPARPYYFWCGISTGEYIIRVLIEALTGVPVVITWLLFVYPSRVYITYFYLETWSGRFLAQIILLCRSNNGGDENIHLPTTNPTINKQKIRV